MEWQFVPSILTIDPTQWNRLCPSDYPFIRHEFLAALETSKATCAQTGWQPHHLIAIQEGTLIAALPSYLKTHSYGEYVFDWAWADAYRRYGQEYYPKLLSAIPFTPCYGSRLLIHPEHAIAIHQVMPLIQAEISRLHLSGWHCLFPELQESNEWRDAGAQQRLGCQFHWFNRGYKHFDDFLATMNSRKRKNILKERRILAEQNISFEWLVGTDIHHHNWDAFYPLYRNTYLKRSGHSGYLTQDFFHRLGSSLADHVLLVNAKRMDSSGQQQLLASALFLRDSHTLYGRYWGSFDDYTFLHFETCYYQGIEFAIASNLQRFDGGAQGEHKIQRGFEPVLTYSNHWLRDLHFQQAITKALDHEAINIQAYLADATTYLPFK